MCVCVCVWGCSGVYEHKHTSLRIELGLGLGVPLIYDLCLSPCRQLRLGHTTLETLETFFEWLIPNNQQLGTLWVGYEACAPLNILC